jgi:hypothetical protein
MNNKDKKNEWLIEENDSFDNSLLFKESNNIYNNNIINNNKNDNTLYNLTNLDLDKSYNNNNKILNSSKLEILKDSIISNIKIRKKKEITENSEFLNTTNLSKISNSNERFSEKQKLQDYFKCKFNNFYSLFIKI